MSVTVREALKLGMQKLRDIQNAELDVWVLLSYIMKIDNHLNLSLIQDQYISEQSIDAFISLLERREKREPIALIIGYKEFWSLNFYVNKSTLIPRPETELIIDSVLERCKRDEYKMLDLGVGSGCISIALLHEYQASECMGVDFSEEALSVAKINAVTHNVAHRLNFVKSNWLDEVPKTQFDIIVSNPPYISLDDMNLLMPDVSFFEPHSALTDFNDGMKHYKSILQDLHNYMHHDTLCFFEFGANQSSQISDILRYYEYDVFEIKKDLSGMDRVVIFGKQ